MKYKIINTYLLSSAVVSALLTASSASAQNIFVANWYNPGAIYEFTPGSSPSTYYSGGLGEPEDIAFNSSGDLFVANSSGNAIDEITPGSDPTESSFASIPDPHGLAFDSAGDLYISGNNDGDIYEIKAGTTTVTTFTTGLNTLAGLAFDQAGFICVSI